MKRTFDNLQSEKKDRIIRACIEEFSEKGYERSSTAGIIKRAGISKGGLYEYTSSKEELFLFIVDYTYGKLYDYLRVKSETDLIKLPSDILKRLRVVSELAIDFYLEFPEFVHLIVRTHELSDEELERKVAATFQSNFIDIFGDIETEGLKFDKEKILELAMWLLLKTRYDFLLEIRTERDERKIKEDYLANWDFYLSVMRSGIYR